MGASINVAASWALSGEPLGEVRMRPEDSVWDLRQKLSKHTGHGRLKVLFHDRMLQDSESLRSAGFRDGDSVNIVGVVQSPPLVVATASADFTAKLWNAETGDCLQTLCGHKDWVTCVAFSPDGFLLLTASRDTTAMIWDLRGHQGVRSLVGHTFGVRSAAFAPDGLHAATASDDRTAKVWEVASCECVWTLTGHLVGVRSTVFSPDGRLLATASSDHTVLLWRLLDRSTVCSLAGHDAPVLSCAFSPCGSRIISTSGNVALLFVVKDALDSDGQDGLLLSGKTLTSTQTLIGHRDIVVSAQYSPVGDRIATASCDYTTRVWDSCTADCLLVLSGASELAVSIGLSGHCDFVFAVAFSPDGTLLLTAGGDWYTSVWLAWKHEHVGRLCGHTGSVFSAAFRPC
mmetsp:Transcript_54463/g.151766  ORF Transcript_54463/g.151766 Transcript_54463/m.151766 type:complete len:402 (+) Transcript_54463:167-1372(+)